MAMFDKQALVIGNDDYGGKNQLHSCVYDAKMMTHSLHSIGFNVQREINLRSNEMLSISRQFAQSIRPGAIVVFYFSGHAGEFNGENYLYALDLTTVNAQNLLKEMHRNKPRVVIFILDCCRSPISSLDSRAFGLDGRSRLRNGLVPMAGPPSTIIAFSSAAGEPSVAAKAGQNSKYTKYLLRYIRTPNMDIDIVLKQAAVDVQRASINGQIPYLYSNCNERICLNVIPWPNAMQFNPPMMLSDRRRQQNQYVAQSIWPYIGNFSYPYYGHVGMINNQYSAYENPWYNILRSPYT
ncbi:unnamed protein product [Adineta steineri]|uniref:Caspase family p20 domain-containing protein n=1 Tax=Adineta steineri TaxID=433720 RepID=A0A820AK04_9BILA|nr:unnamed protein product [Adineta steineri]CAF4194440.1 unnamed protein product [Adineta steineri]